jgi:hypothetical protein
MAPEAEPIEEDGRRAIAVALTGWAVAALVGLVALVVGVIGAVRAGGPGRWSSPSGRRPGRLGGYVAGVVAGHAGRHEAGRGLHLPAGGGRIG